MSKKGIGRYFDRYSENWAAVKTELHSRLRVEPDLDDVFICPLCFNKVYTRESINENLLSFEHVPPQAAGGQIRTLTCKDCNNQHGNQLDSHLVKRIAYQAAFTGQSTEPVPAQMTVNGETTLPIDFYPRQNGNMDVVPVKSMIAKNKRQIDAFTEHLNADEVSFQLRMNLPNERRADLALVRAAYLWCFSVFGYGFLINPSLRVIRGQINHPSEKILPTFGVIQQDFPDEALGLNVITSPVELRSFFVVFDVKATNNVAFRYGVVMPGPSDPGLAVYHFLAEHKTMKSEVQLKHFNIEQGFDFVEAPLEAHLIWRDCTG